jgi:hypothetical protein
MQSICLTPKMVDTDAHHVTNNEFQRMKQSSCAGCIKASDKDEEKLGIAQMSLASTVCTIDGQDTTAIPLWVHTLI